jgi:hypothetical protein
MFLQSFSENPARAAISITVQRTVARSLGTDGIDKVISSMIANPAP